jgi:hypothetical protein
MYPADAEAGAGEAAFAPPAMVRRANTKRMIDADMHAHNSPLLWRRACMLGDIVLSLYSCTLIWEDIFAPGLRIRPLQGSHNGILWG